MQSSLKKSRGFTLIELMVVIAIGAIVLAVGIPSFKDFMAQSEIAATNNTFVRSLQVARSASMERLEPAGLCASSNSMADDASCTNGAGYGAGWFVYADANANGQRDPGEEILERTEAPSDAFTFTPSGPFADQIYFNDSGASITTAGVPMSGEVEVDYGDGIQVRKIVVSANGRIATTETP